MGSSKKTPHFHRERFRDLNASRGKRLWRSVELSFRERLSSMPRKMGHLWLCEVLGGEGTVVGAFSDALESGPSPLNPPLSVGLIGLGTVGCEVYRRVVASTDLRLASILVKDAQKKRSVDSSIITTDPSVFFKSGADLIIDCSNPSESLNIRLLQALENGARVVTANKGNLADDLDAWAPWIQQGRVRHSATVGGVVSMLETTREEKTQSQIQQFRAVLNGTCNYILDRLHAGQSFQDALWMKRKHSALQKRTQVPISMGLMRHVNVSSRV